MSILVKIANQFGGKIQMWLKSVKKIAFHKNSTFPKIPFFKKIICNHKSDDDNIACLACQRMRASLCLYYFLHLLGVRYVSTMIVNISRQQTHGSIKVGKSCRFCCQNSLELLMFDCFSEKFLHRKLISCHFWKQQWSSRKS